MNTITPIPILINNDGGGLDTKTMLAIYIVVSILTLISILVGSAVQYFRQGGKRKYWVCLLDGFNGDSDMFSFFNSISFVSIQIIGIVFFLVNWVITLFD